MCHYATTPLFSNTVASSGRIAGILRAAAAGGFKHGLQHDCHEALTFILSIAYDEETKLLKQRRQHLSSDASTKNQQYLGVIAKNFGIEERVELTVRVTVVCICFDCAFSPVAQPVGSAQVVVTCDPSSTLGLLFPFRWHAPPLAEK